MNISGLHRRILSPKYFSNGDLAHLNKDNKDFSENENPDSMADMIMKRPIFVKDNVLDRNNHSKDRV